MGLLKDSTANVDLSIDIDKLKAVKKLTAKVCCVEGCDNIGRWKSKGNNFYLENGMCQMHYRKLVKHGDPLARNIYEWETSKHPLYHTWEGIKSRILNKKAQNYKNYGKIGLEIEPRWTIKTYGFRNFLEDISYLGERPEGYTLDRKDGKLGYFANNLKWSNNHEQNRNKLNMNNTVGVSHHITKNKNKIYVYWMAFLKIKNKRFQELFKTEQEAITQRKAWEMEYEIYD